jgi:hypothetical protein
MSESATPSQRDQELRELRARAYGPHPDIQDDPEALARLAELESVRLDEHASAGSGEHASQEPVRLSPETVVVIEAPMPDAMVAAREPVQPRSAWQKVWATPTGRVWLIGGSLVVIIAVIYAVTWFAPQRPEATLQPTGIEAEGHIRSAVTHAPLAELDTTTLRGYEAYRGVEPWVADGAQGTRCLMVIERATLQAIRCAPPEAELTVDLGAWPLDSTYPYMEGLADGTVIRFQLHGDAVDAYVYPPPNTE